MNIYDVPELQKYLNPQGIDPRSFQSIFPMGVPFNPRSIQSIFPTNVQRGITASSAAIPFGSPVDIAQGFPRNTPSDQGTNFQFLESANERDVADEVERPKRFNGLASLFKALLGFAVPGAGLLLGGLNTLRNTDFLRSDNLVDFLDMQKYGGYEGRERARRKTMTEARDLQRRIDRGDFNKDSSGITDRGRGDRSPAPSRPSRSAPSYEAAGRAFAGSR